jgi:predicted O-linked N-acetylglucosamine transferase (SPINDLY family)
LQATYAGFLRALISKRRPDLLELPKVRGNAKAKIVAGRKRIRVVFVSSFFRECTVGHYFSSWITDLDSPIFERIVIHTGWQPDEFGRGLQARCDGFVLARGGTLSVAEAIRAQAADIVIYPEVGMGKMNYLLTNMRLAPIQIAAWGHPVTTGSQEIDYFLTCEAMEPLNEFTAAAHCTERLLMLPGIGTRYIMPSANNFNLTRETFGLPAGSHVYICSQSLFKIHPDNDSIYIDIMGRDNKAVVLFFQSEHRAITQAFSQRLAAMMAARGQIKILPRLDATSFRGVLSFADVVLDTLHWSGGNTSLDALAVAAPVVTLPSELMRGRQTQAMLGAMGANELVVADQEGYVCKAIEVARDSGIGIALSHKIAMDRGAVFDRREPVKQLAQHLLRLFDAVSK